VDELSIANLGVDGPQNMFALDRICLYHISVQMDDQLMMDRRGGLELLRERKLADIPLSMLGRFPMCVLCKYEQLFEKGY